MPRNTKGSPVKEYDKKPETPKPEETKEQPEKSAPIRKRH